MTIERIESFLRNATESERDIIVKKLVEFNVIPTVCNVMQMSDDNFVKYVSFSYSDINVTSVTLTYLSRKKEKDKLIDK